MADFVYSEAKSRILTNTLNVVTASLKMMLVTPSYIPNPEHIYISAGVTSPSNFEIAGTGYVPGFAGSGRLPLINKHLVKDTSIHKMRFIFNNISWLGLSVPNQTIGGCIIVLETGISDATSLLIMFRSSGGFSQPDPKLNWG
jgi:hypothetical protein